MVQISATSLLFKILCILLLFVTSSYQNRRYDIESESLKLYGEDLATVLLRFRRTPEYLKILEEKHSDFEVFLSDVQNQITYYYLDQLDKKIKEMIGIGANKTEDKSLRKLNDDCDDEVGDKSITGVQRLDSYSKLSSPLTLAQRNAMRDLGFAYAGHIIHALIQNSGTETVDVSSTMQPEPQIDAPGGEALRNKMGEVKEDKTDARTQTDVVKQKKDGTRVQVNRTLVTLLK